MSATTQSSFDPSKIITLNNLLGAFLITVEIFLGVWFAKAGSGAERITAGALVVFTFLAFLLVIWQLNAKKEEATTTITPTGLGSITPVIVEATKQQLDSPQPETIVGPDKSYTIARPPDNWIIKELTLDEWLAQGLGVSDLSLVEKLTGKSVGNRDILSFQTKTATTVIPIPGKTTVDGRKILAALGSSNPARLAIIPMDRAQPPLFIPRPLVHNFFTLVSGFVTPGLLTMHKQSSVPIPNSNRQKLVAEFRQDIENAIVNGQEGKNISVNTVIYGIEGEVRDHVLLMNYPAQAVADDPEMAENLSTLDMLINSFKPARVVNPEAKLKEYKEKADKDFQEGMAVNGENIFTTELFVLMYRLDDMDLDNADNLPHIMKMLKPFEVLAKEINLQNENFDGLWEALGEAEKGNAVKLKETLEELIESAKNVGKESPDLPPAAEAAMLTEGTEVPSENEEGKPN